MVGVSEFILLAIVSIVGYVVWVNWKYVRLGYKLVMKNKARPTILDSLPTRRGYRIKVQHCQHDRDIFIPASTDLARRMGERRFFLIHKDGKEETLNLYPGIPLLLSGKQMGGVGLRVEELDKQVVEQVEGDVPLSFFSSTPPSQTS